MTIRHFLWRLYALPYQWIGGKYKTIKYSTWGKNHQVYQSCMLPCNLFTKDELRNIIKNNIPYIKVAKIRVDDMTCFFAYRVSFVTLGRYYKILPKVIKQCIAKKRG